MTGRIKIIRKTTSVVDGRRQQEEQDFFSCWCDVKSLGTNEKYNALQIGLENTIVFETKSLRQDGGNQIESERVLCSV